MHLILPKACARFAFVGPLLLPSAPCTDPAVLRVREARAAGHRVVAVSMGTVITGGDKEGVGQINPLPTLQCMCFLH